VVNISKGGPAGDAQAQQGRKKNRWDDCSPDCSPNCDCDLPGCDCGFTMISALTVGRLFRLGAPPRRSPRLTRPTVPARAGMAAIRGYQRWISHRLGTRCRHVPNCSAYGMEAVRRYGLGAGTHLTAQRIRRCTAPTPYGTVDPVP
jgi:putative membrane protein insertion efficiency factor